MYQGIVGAKGIRRIMDLEAMSFRKEENETIDRQMKRAMRRPLAPLPDARD
jgi:hypothetical protein